MRTVSDDLFAGFVAMTNLQVLDLSTIGVSRLGKSLKLPNSLKSLYLANNQLSDTPKAVFSLDKLEILDLR
jgi:Leucine-rich repeat (LRR) protein